MWTPVSFAHPPAAAAIGDSLSGSLDGLSAALSAGSAALGGLGLPATVPPGSGVDELRGRASGLFADPARCLAVTPYTGSVGHRRGEQAYLTPKEAAAAMAARLGTDEAESAALVLVLLAAPEPGSFAQALAAFNRVFPIVELQRAERRAEALAGLEERKFVIPPAPGYPALSTAAPERDATGRALSRAVGAQLALAEGQDAARVPPVVRLAVFAARRAEDMARKRADLATLAAGMNGTGPGWHGAYLEGGTMELAGVLAASAPPLDAAYKCCAAVCWQGSREQVAYFKEAFGL